MQSSFSSSSQLEAERYDLALFTEPSLLHRLLFLDPREEYASGFYLRSVKDPRESSGQQEYRGDRDWSGFISSGSGGIALRLTNDDIMHAQEHMLRT